MCYNKFKLYVNIYRLVLTAILDYYNFEIQGRRLFTINLYVGKFFI